MAKIQIDGVEYDTDEMSENAKAQLTSFQFCEAELQRLQMEAALLQTASRSYGNALREQLLRDKEERKGQAEVINTLATEELKTEGTEEKSIHAKKGGLFSGLFGKK